MNLVNPYRFKSGGSPDLTNLVHYWRLATDANDYKGSANPSVESNIVYNTTNPPPFDTHSANWDRVSNSKIGIPFQSTFANNPMTISFWIRKLVNENFSVPMCNREASFSNYNWSLTYNNSNSITTTFSNGDGFAAFQDVLGGGTSLNSWRYITLSYSQDLIDPTIFSFKQYISGALISEETNNNNFTGFIDSPRLWLGNDRGRTTSTSSMTAQMAGVAIFNTQLPDETVLSIYEYMNSGNHLI